MGQLLIMDSLLILGGRLCLVEASDKLKGECHHHCHHNQGSSAPSVIIDKR